MTTGLEASFRFGGVESGVWTPDGEEGQCDSRLTDSPAGYATVRFGGFGWGGCGSGGYKILWLHYSIIHCIHWGTNEGYSVFRFWMGLCWTGTIRC